MSSPGHEAAVEALGEVIAAYRRRIAELEAIVASQQRQLDESKVPAGDAS